VHSRSLLELTKLETAADATGITLYLLEYVIVHEMVHLIEPTHSDRFIAILGEHYPSWREARAELNDLPLAAEVWKE
jgi:predicted metal-dependent hydrolase